MDDLVYRKVLEDIYFLSIFPTMDIFIYRRPNIITIILFHMLIHYQ